MFLQFELKHDETMFNTILGQRTKTYLNVTPVELSPFFVSSAFHMYVALICQAAAISMEKCSARYVLSTMSIAKRENLSAKTPESESHFGDTFVETRPSGLNNVLDSEMNEVG